MDGVTKANYALSLMANVGVQQPWPAREQTAKNNEAAPEKGVGAIGTQQLPGLRPEDAGAKIMRSVDGDTISISAEGQAYVQQTAAAADTPDTTSATARVEGEETGFGQPFGQPFGAEQTERPAETRFDLPQGGGIERPDFEQPQVQQIQDAAEEDQAAERAAPQLQPRQEEQTIAELPKKEEPQTVEPSDFRQYFNSELRQMLYRGQITQQQYDDEIESRKTEDDQKIDKKVI